MKAVIKLITVYLVFFFGNLHAQYKITTIAGINPEGADAKLANITEPKGISKDRKGNIYLADAFSNRIRKIDISNGKVYTVAGNGAGIFVGDGGLATQASLKRPESIRFDSKDNMYILDQGNYRIRKVDTKTGIISTIAGIGINGQYPTGDGGLAIQAGINPYDFAIDSEDNLYLTCGPCYRIRKIDAKTNIITTIAGNGTRGYNGDNIKANVAQIDHSRGIVIDPQDNIYFAEYSRIRKINTQTGIITTVLRVESGSTFRGFHKLAIDLGGNIYFTDYSKHQVFKFDPNAPETVAVIAGIGTQGFSGDNGPAIQAEFDRPEGLLVDNQGNILVADWANNRIRKIEKVSNNITTIIGKNHSYAIYGYSGDKGIATNAMLFGPAKTALDKFGNLYIADQQNHCIRKVNLHTGTISTIAGTGTKGFSGDNDLATQAQLYDPIDVAVDALGNIYIADKSNHRIRMVDAQTGIITTISGVGSTGPNQGGYSGDNNLAKTAKLNHPHGIALDTRGNLYIADLGNSRVRKIDVATKMITTIAGTGNWNYNGDNILATNASLNPVDITFDTLGNLYIADGSNNRIRRIDAVTKMITTIAGTGEIGFTPDGLLGTATKIHFPQGITIDKLGNVFIAGLVNRKVRRLDAKTNRITTIAGIRGLGHHSEIYSGDEGLAILARIAPSGITLDHETGEIYLAEPSNSVIRKLTPLPEINLNHASKPLQNNDTLSFGSVTYNTNPKRLLCTIKNTGIAPLKLDKISISSGFQLATPLNLPYSVEVGASLTIAVQMNTDVTGEKEGILVIQSNDLDEVIFKLKLLGEVVKASQIITFTSLSDKTYGTLPFILSGNSSSGLPLTYRSSNPDILKISQNNLVTIIGTGKVIITAIQGGNSNYLPASSIARTLIVRKASQSITFGEITDKIYGDTPFILDGFTSSGLSVAYETSNDSIVSITNNQVTIIGAGTVTITAQQAGDSNYYPASNVSQILTVSKANQSISFILENSTIDHNNKEDGTILTGSASSGLPIEYISSNSSVATVIKDVMIVKGIGITMITATQRGNKNYHPADSIVRELKVISNITALDESLTGNKVLFKSYPNPVNDKLYVVFEGQGQGVKVNITLFDSKGKSRLRLVHQITENSPSEISLKDLPSGTYYLNVVIRGETFVQKIIKE